MKIHTVLSHEKYNTDVAPPAITSRSIRYWDTDELDTHDLTTYFDNIKVEDGDHLYVVEVEIPDEGGFHETMDWIIDYLDETPMDEMNIVMEHVS